MALEQLVSVAQHASKVFTSTREVHMESNANVTARDGFMIAVIPTPVSIFVQIPSLFLSFYTLRGSSWGNYLHLQALAPSLSLNLDMLILGRASTLDLIFPPLRQSLLIGRSDHTPQVYPQPHT